MSFRDKIIYVSGKYSESTKEARQVNIDRMMDVAAKVWDRGYTCISPNGNTAHLDDIVKGTTYKDFIEGDCYIISRCDAVLMMDNWKSSKGATEEREYALRIGKPVLYSLEELANWNRPDMSLFDNSYIDLEEDV